MIAVILFFSSCGGAKPGATKSTSLYETFFVGDAGSQYFINPLIFVGTDNNKLLVDFTFRYKDRVKDSLTCNFSIINNIKMKKVDNLLLAGEDVSVKCENITLLFNDTKGNQFLSRFSGRILFADFNRLVNAGDFSIKADGKVYGMSAKTQKSVKKLRKKLFVLFD